MYDRIETAEANDRFWALIRDAVGYGPTHLTRGGDLHAQWLSPDLAFSQTCGMPFRTELYGKVTRIGTPDYGVEGCPPGYYRSLFITRAGDPRDTVKAFADARFAYNDAGSQSGWAAPFAHAANLGMTFRDTYRTGGHRASALAVAENSADLAAIDAVTWAMIQRYDAIARDLVVIDRTAPTPGLPYIAARAANADDLHRAVGAAIDALSPEDRETLLIKAVVAIPDEAYLAIQNPPAP
jgi:ABC-type phosphate/phosphonate transport system substrate-binding protein